MGDIIDAYGGYENLARYTDEHGDVDFDAAYNDIMEQAEQEMAEQVAAENDDEK